MVHLYLPQRITYLLLILLTSCHIRGWSQNAPSSGTEYWFGSVDAAEGSGNTAHAIQILAHDTATGTIEAPGVPWSVNFSVGPNSSFTVTIPPGVNSYVADSIENKGIHIQASDSIMVYIIVTPGGLANGDASAMYPVESMDTAYIASIYNNIWTLPQFINKPLFMVTAMCDSTLIEITAMDTTSGGILPGVPDTILLNQGDNYYIKPAATNSAAGLDPTGTMFRSVNKPAKKFACYSALSATYVLPGGSNQCCSDRLGEQMAGLSHWGTKFLNASLPMACGEVYRFVAASNDTEIWINGLPAFTLQALEHVDTVINEEVYIESSKPMDVFTIEQMNDCNGFYLYGMGDPDFLRILPIDQMITRSRFSNFHDTNTMLLGVHYLMVITKTMDTAEVTLNGGPVGAPFIPFGSQAGYSYCIAELGDGLFAVESPKGFQGYYFELMIYGSSGFPLNGVSNITGDSVIESGILVDLGPDTALCNDTIILGSGHTSELLHIWSTGSTDTAITINAPGIYWVSVQDPWDCYPRRGSDTIVVLDTFPPAPSIGNDTAICSGLSLLLTVDAVPGSTVTWMDSVVSNVFTVEDSGTYYVRVTEGNCHRYDTIVVGVLSSPDIVPLPDVGTCDTSLIIAGSYSGGSPPYEYTWVFANEHVLAGVTTSQQMSLDIDADMLYSGTYTLYLQDSNGCSDSAFFQVDKLTPAPLSFEVSQQVTPAGCDSAAILVEISQPADSVVWTVNGSTYTGDLYITDFQAYNSTFSGYASIFYTDTMGCPLRDSISFIYTIPSIGELMEFGERVRPNVFTPNGDGVNDCFDALFINGWTGCSDEVSFIVYNRWGMEVFRSHDDNKCWDGQIAQKQAPEGVYYYIAMIDSSVFQGSLTLMR